MLYIFLLFLIFLALYGPITLILLPNWDAASWAQAITALTALVAVFYGPKAQLKIAERQIAENVAARKGIRIGEFRQELAGLLELSRRLIHLEHGAPPTQETKSQRNEALYKMDYLNNLIKLRLDLKKHSHKNLLDTLHELYIKMKNFARETQEGNEKFLNEINEIHASIIEQSKIIFLELEPDS